MTQAISTIVALVCLGSTATAVSLTMDTDQTVYSVGESITVTLLGATTGALPERLALATVEYDSLLVSAPATASQTQITSFNGNILWSLRTFPCTASACSVFDQFAGSSPEPPDPDIEVGTLVLTAAAPGVLVIGTSGVDWFSAPAPPDVTVTIIPEPGTLGLLALGLLGLALGRRR